MPAFLLAGSAAVLGLTCRAAFSSLRIPMKTPLTKLLTMAVATASSLLTLGLFTPAFGGPERIADNSKDKVQLVEQPEEPKWYVSIGVGTDIDTGATDFSNGFNASFLVPSGAFTNVIGAVTSGIIPGRFEGAELNIKSRSWDDAYSNFARIRAEVGRRVICKHFEVFGAFEYTHADAETVTGSSITAFFSSGNLEFPIVSKFGDYNAWGGELGARWFFLCDGPIRPYISIAGGATYVDCIGLHSWTNVFGVTETIFKGPFYSESIVGTGTGMIGLESQVTRRFSVGAEAGLRYQSTLCPNDREFESFSMSPTLQDLAKINDNAGDRLVIPVTFFAKLRF